MFAEQKTLKGGVLQKQRASSGRSTDMSVKKAAWLKSVSAAAAAATLCASGALAQGLSAEQLDMMVPKHPEFLGALAPENLNAERPAPPFDLTGTWFVDLSGGFGDFLFGSQGYPNFYEEGQRALREAAEAQARGETYRDAIGQCFPAGMPMIMTRVWPIAMVQTPTVIFMVSNFNNEFRQIFLDGRDFTDPDLVIPTYNGESIGRWEGDTLVVHTKYFEPENHYIDRGIPISEEFEMIERMRLVNDGRQLEIEYIMTDPQNWDGEWRNTKRWNREDYTDINEVHCLPNLNEHLPGTVGGQTALDARAEDGTE
jgi:hypothetical protein